MELCSSVHLIWLSILCLHFLFLMFLSLSSGAVGLYVSMSTNVDSAGSNALWHCSRHQASNGPLTHFRQVLDHLITRGRKDMSLERVPCQPSGRINRREPVAETREVDHGCVPGGTER